MMLYRMLFYRYNTLVRKLTSWIGIALFLLVCQACGARRLKTVPPTPTGHVDNDLYTVEKLIFTDTTGTASQYIMPYLKELIDTYPSEDVFYYLLAREYQKRGYSDSAIILQTKAVEIDSSNQDYLNNLYLLKEQSLTERQITPQEASEQMLDIAQRLTQLDSTNPKYWYYLAVNYLHLQRPDKTLQVCREHYKQLSVIPGLDLLICNAYMQRRECDSAMGHAEQMLQHSKGGSIAYFVASEMAQYCGNDSLAGEYFMRGLQYGCPTWEGAKRILPILGKGVHGEKGMAVKALASLYTRCAILPEQQKEAIEIILYSTKRETLRQPENLQFFDTLFAYLPHEEAYWLLQYRFYKYVTPERNLLVVLRGLTEQKGDTYIWWNLRLREEWQQAEEAQNNSALWDSVDATVQKIITLYPFDLNPALLQLSRYYFIGTQESKEKYLNTLNQYIAQFQMRLKRTKRQDVFKVVVQEGSVTEIPAQETLKENLSVLLGAKADWLIQNGEYEAAWDIYDQALVYNPNNATALNNYAYFLANHDKRKLSKAQKLSYRALEVTNHSQVEFLDTYGYILYLQEQYEEARNIFIKVLSINSNPSATILYHYSDVLKALGKESAAEVYRLKAQNATDN